MSSDVSGKAARPWGWLRGLFDHTAVVLGRDFSLFLVGARTDQAIAQSRTSLGARGAFEAAYTRSADPWRAATGRYRYQQRKYEQIVSILPDRRYARALDLGCGLGLLTQMMAPKCDHVLGIDISEAAVALARTRAGEIGNMEFAQGDVLTLPPSMDGRFDLVMIADTLYYLDPLDDATLKGLVARMADLLAPGGICVLANHFFYDIDAESRVSRRIHDAFAWSPRFAVEGQYRRAFFLASVLAGQA